MGKRLTKLVTRTGDRGETGLADGSRVHKSSPRIQAIGEIDELNCWLGVVLAGAIPGELDAVLRDVQQRLFDLGGELALPERRAVGEDAVAGLEARIEELNAALPPLREFILPGGAGAAAFCHLARAVCRRAERQLAALAVAETGLNPLIPVYINRLSDLLFVIARVLARHDHADEIFWEPRRP